MRDILIQDDVNLVENRLKQFETNTGCELLLVIANESDPYPGAFWRFGFVASFVFMLIFSHYLDFHHNWLWPLSFFVVTALMVWVGHFPWAKRLALADWEVERECREKALELFHTLGTSKVTHKVTAMIMVSTLERNIQILIDEKLKTELTQHELDDLVTLMKSHFQQGNVGLGLVNSIAQFEEKILLDFGGKVSELTSSELSDTIHFIR